MFEQQLAILFQSFGFYVVPTRRGTRSVDLLCIWPDPHGAFTLFVEAKTTKRRYALPADDERALGDYVEDVRRLRTVPPLRLVLIVSAEAARTLPAKLERIERRLGTPTRFINAGTLAAIRELVPGPLPVDAFLDSALAGDRVVADSIADEVRARYQSDQAAHVEFVRRLRFPTPSAGASARSG